MTNRLHIWIIYPTLKTRSIMRRRKYYNASTVATVQGYCALSHQVDDMLYGLQRAGMTAGSRCHMNSW
jgi:hypothetical protein